MNEKEKNNTNEENWFSEIIRETEHYYQAEMQQEQRASWILASVCILLTLFIGFEPLVDGFTSPVFLLMISYILLFISGLISIITIIPLKGITMKCDLFGKSVKKYITMDPACLVKKRFLQGQKWTLEKYKEQIYLHFKSHLLRAKIKGYGVIWSSLFLILGLICLFIIGLIEIVN